MAIDPGFLDELSRLEASLTRETESRRRGEQRSPNVGEGLTFSDYRRYTPGDDVRLIDWRVHARTDEYFIKQYEAERDLTVHVLVDTSASMDYGDGDENKFTFAAKFGLGFAYFAAAQHDTFRAATIGTSVDRLDRRRSNRGELLRLLDAMNEITPEGRTDFLGSLEAYARTIQSRSLVVIVSDFLDDPDTIEDGLAALAGNDVLLIHTIAPGERAPDATGDTVFEDPETGATHRSYFAGRTVDAYRNRLDSHVDDVAARARTFRAEHTVVDTGTDFFDAFAEVWRREAARARPGRRR